MVYLETTQKQEVNSVRKSPAMRKNNMMSMKVASLILIMPKLNLKEMTQLVQRN